jgi:hypothetical protein
MVDTFQLWSKYSVAASVFSSSLVPIVLNATCSLFFGSKLDLLQNQSKSLIWVVPGGNLRALLGG